MAQGWDWIVHVQGPLWVLVSFLYYDLTESGENANVTRAKVNDSHHRCFLDMLFLFCRAVKLVIVNDLNE